MSTQLTPKFALQLTKFIKWADSKNGKLQTINDEPVSWSTDIIKFEEPGRNKLESFLNKVLATYSITFDSILVEDVKSLCTEFKEYKPEKIKKSKKKDITPIIDTTLDTSKTVFIDTLSIKYAELVDGLGEPQICNDPEQKYQHEFKIKVGKVIYSIYDWKNSDYEFTDPLETRDFHLAGTENVPIQGMDWIKITKDEDEDEFDVFNKSLDLSTDDLKELEDSFKKNLKVNNSPTNSDDFNIEE